MLQCNDLYKSFGEKKVLSGIGFDIPDGQIFGLLGPSGAGKTTLIKILTGQIPADSGDVTILGKKVEQLTGLDKKKIGIMMDHFGVYERLSCSDNLKIFADIFGIPHAKVKETLILVGLEEAANRPAFNLSKGMRTRLQLARVFMQDPDVIFLDEPTSGLDPQTMRSIHRIILDKKKEGCTIFLTTHNMEEASCMCNTVALINEGKVVECGKPKEIRTKYNHEKKIIVNLVDGKELEILQGEEGVEKIYELFKSNQIETIHSSEPSLENVFLQLTGKKLEEDE